MQSLFLQYLTTSGEVSRTHFRGTALLRCGVSSLEFFGDKRIERGKTVKSVQPIHGRAVVLQWDI